MNFEKEKTVREAKESDDPELRMLGYILEALDNITKNLTATRVVVNLNPKNIEEARDMIDMTTR